MGTDIATTNGKTSGRPPAPMPEVVERVIAMGDLSRLSTEDRVAYYVARCEAAGLDPRTQPFQYLSLQGKLTLYATKTATDQLIAMHRLNVQILSRGFDADGIYVVQCRVSFPDGHSVEDVGVLFIAPTTQGEALANAYMKAITKAKRRTVLSACGLGILDETEVETIPGAVVVPQGKPDNQSGHGQGMYASPAQSEAWVKRLEGYVAARNQRWLDRWTEEVTGEVPSGLKDLCNVWQADNHLLKWARETGRLDPASGTEEGQQHRQIGRFTAIVVNRSKADEKAICKELERYLDEQEARQGERLRALHPDLFPGESDEAQATADDDPAEAS